MYTENQQNIVNTDNNIFKYNQQDAMLHKLLTRWHKKNENFWKTQQKLKKSKKKNLLTEIEPLQLAF